MKHTAYLGIGSNVEAERHVRIAIDALRRRFGDIVISPVYRSTAVGFEGDDFLNLAVCIETELDPYQLRNILRELEAEHGRDRDAPKWSDRTLDIDILLYDDLVVYDDQLEIPRREIMKFAHVLRPLADIAPDIDHPGENRSLSEIRNALSLDEFGMSPIDFNFSG